MACHRGRDYCHDDTGIARCDPLRSNRYFWDWPLPPCVYDLRENARHLMQCGSVLGHYWGWCISECHVIVPARHFAGELVRSWWEPPGSAPWTWQADARRGGGVRAGWRTSFDLRRGSQRGRRTVRAATPLMTRHLQTTRPRRRPHLERSRRWQPGRTPPGRLWLRHRTPNSSRRLTQSCGLPFRSSRTFGTKSRNW